MLSKRFALFAGIGALAGTASYASPARQLSGETLYPDGDPNTGSTTTHGCSVETSKIPCEGHGGGGYCEWDTAETSCSAVSGESSESESSGSSCTGGLPVVKWAVEIADTANANARTELCGDANVLCSTNAIVAKFDAGTTTLSYDDSDNWQVKSGDTVVLTSAGYKFNLIDYTLKDTTTVADTQLVDLVALNTQLDAGTTVTNCDSTFQAAVAAYTALQVPCEEVGNTRKDLAGACATGTDACVVGYEYSDEDKKCKVKLTYTEPDQGTAAFKAQHKRNYFKSIRKGGVVKRGSESDAAFEKRKFAQMRTYTREYFKQKMQDRIDDNSDNKKKHQMRKEERMPLSIAAESDDFKPNLKAALVTKFGADRDVGIIVGPVNTASPEACATWLSSTDDKSDFDDEDKCITYDAAIDGATTDVHVLGNDDSYSVGGLLIGGKYEPVVKQKVAVLTDETFEVSCWSGDAWTAQDKDAGAGGTQHWAAGDEVQCTVTKGGVVTVVDTIVGSLTTGQVDGDKCDVGYGCARKSEDPTSADYLVCADTFACEPCESPEANNAVDATVCAAQLCEAGKGYNGQGVVFDPNLDPDVQDNDNCGTCQDGTYNTGANGQCVAYSTDATCSAGYERDLSHDSKEADAPCVDVQAPTINSGGTATAIDENSGAGEVVYTASANDNSGNVVTFSLSGADTALSIDSATGAVTLTANPDYETQDVYAFTVVATDGASNSASKAVTLAINNVPDVECTKALDCNNVGTASGFRDSTEGCSCDCDSANTGKQGTECKETYDNVAPQFTSADTATAINENSGARQVVYTASATDTSNDITYSLSGTDASAFTIDQSSGEVTLTADPDHETKSSYSFKVVAIDAAGNEAEQAVTLDINNVLDVECTKALDCNGEGTASGFRDSTQGCLCKCGVGYGCMYDGAVDTRVCLTGANFGCEKCQIPEANGNVAAAPCLAQKCVAGEGAFISSISSGSGVTDLAQKRGAPFDDEQDPNDCGKVADASGDKCGNNAEDADDGNPNCVPCPPGFYSESNNGYCYPVMEQTLQDTHIEIGAVLVKSSENQNRFQGSIGVPQWYKITGGDVNGFEIKYCPGLECYGEGETGWAHDVWPDNDWGLATTGNPFLASSNCDVSESSTVDATLTAQQIKTKYKAAQVLFLSGSPLIGENQYYIDILVTNAEQAQDTQKQINNCYEEMQYPEQLLFPNNLVNWNDYKIFEVSSDADYPRIISLPPDASAKVYATVSQKSDQTFQNSYRIYAKYENGESVTVPSVFTSTGPIWLSWLPYDFNTEGITSLEIQFSKEAVAAVKFSDLTLGLGEEAAKPDWWRFCKQSRGEEIKDGYPSCAECEDGKYAVNNLFACASNTVCGTQFDGTTSRLTGASRTSAGTCEECDVGYYAADGQTNCKISNTVCGKQSDGTTSRLTNASSTSAGTCEACDDGYYAENGQTDCKPLTTCQEGTYTKTAGTSKSQTVCETCPDKSFHLGATSPADESSCTSYSTSCTKAGYTRDTGHGSKIADAPCVDVQPPEITSGDTATAIDENSGAGQVVYTASATDTSNDITFSLIGTDASAFTISGSAVTLTADPDHETKSSYSFTVVAIDGASNSASKTVTLAINNLDEEAPSITSGNTATSILETAAAGTTVYTAIATDSGDVSATPITFSLGVTDASAFDIDQSSGKVTLKASPSYETKSSYSFTVTATDGASNSASKTVSLTVLPDADEDSIDDINDPCVYTGCTVQQLTDAYALLTSADACSGSRRTHAHANVYGCKTAGCADETGAIKTAFDTLHSQCPA